MELSLIYGHLCRCIICHSHHMTKHITSSFDGRQAHWAALASFIQSIAGDFLRISDVNDLPPADVCEMHKNETILLVSDPTYPYCT